MIILSYIFVDTGAWYALFDKKDRNNPDAVQFMANTQNKLVTSNHVLVETLNLTKSRMGNQISVDIGRKLLDGSIAHVIQATETDEINAFYIFEQYHDKGFSFTDCTSFALMKRLNLDKAFAFDKHFRQYGGFTIRP